MKHIASIILAIALTVGSLHASTGADNEKHLTAVFSYATFFNYQVGPYFETYISFDAWNMNFVKKGNKYQAVVEVVLTVSKGDSIVIAKKYDLNSPVIDSPEADRFNFIDMQRFALANGVYQLQISIHDKNSSDAPTVVNETLAILYDQRTPRLSSVQMMATVKPTVTENIMSRYGYDMEPYINDFLPEQIGQINYYYEVYNINQEVRDQYVYAFSYIEVLETGRVIESTQSAQRMERDTLIPVFGTIDISQLPSGNYNLVVDIRNKQDDKLLYKKVPFFRSNPSVADISIVPTLNNFAQKITDETQLNDYIEALAPIANEIERREIYSLINRPGIDEKHTFLYQFWTRREGLNAESAWLEYKERVDYVNANFSWPRTKGIQTDRGRVYLQYGAPDYIRDEKNYVGFHGLVNGQIFYLPYQLWRYNQIPGDDINRCFIFWDEFRSGFYKLLHSNAKGEVWDPKWEQRLSQQQLNEDMQGEVGLQFERGF